MDAVLLSRVQFALTIMFHYLFPPLTIGLGVLIVYFLAMHVKTGRAMYERSARFWLELFAVSFAMGVASGVVMEFQFGTNWATYSRYVGDVFGPLLAAEGILAFFLESAFLGILVFAWDRISAGMRLFSAVMVSGGSILSSIWITVANSWQQTPAGFHLVEKVVGQESFLRAEIVDFWAMVFNPSSVLRVVHVWLGAFLLGAFFVMSVSAWYLLKGRHQEFARRNFMVALVLATVCAVLQLVAGHQQARLVAKYQPAKLAAFEGLYQTPEGGAPLYVWGWPDDQSRSVRGGLKVPGLLSFLVYGNFHTPLPGLDHLEEKWGRPPVWLSFQSYHVMVWVGLFFIVLTLYASWLGWRGRLFEKRWLMWVFVGAVVPAYVANELGWVAAEVGRQPWVVYPVVQADGSLHGGLRTAEAVSEAVTAGQVAGSIGVFSLVYAGLFAVWLYVLVHKIRRGPGEAAE